MASNSQLVYIFAAEQRKIQTFATKKKRAKDTNKWKSEIQLANGQTDALFAMQWDENEQTHTAEMWRERERV